jgi:hypothetical protein
VTPSGPPFVLVSSHARIGPHRCRGRKPRGSCRCGNTSRDRGEVVGPPSHTPLPIPFARLERRIGCLCAKTPARSLLGSTEDCRSRSAATSPRPYRRSACRAGCMKRGRSCRRHDAVPPRCAPDQSAIGNCESVTGCPSHRHGGPRVGPLPFGYALRWWQVLRSSLAPLRGPKALGIDGWRWRRARSMLMRDAQA